MGIETYWWSKQYADNNRFMFEKNFKFTLTVSNHKSIDGVININEKIRHA